MMSPGRVEAKARKLLEQSGITSAPVDVELVAKTLGIEIQFDDLDDDVSGFLSVEPGRSVAVINQNHHSNRQRFTIAHELGHYVLHVKSEEGLFIDKKYTVHHRDHKSSLGTIEKEREANLFASSLLMPKAIIQALLDGLRVDFFDEFETHSLAKRLGVSEQALGFRLARLGYEVGE
ncbi:ImmA/IrrE family metallo-endopeptidase [Teredinibacter turnerae]|uniref:ImmA/IrrE family metallo-endopeptidase n=1 Tax=Teredinibacter turnerae TaxID=2426 RepID=UPI000364F6EE|nr:ImmA/IrrE family metallo-endopeptidase [Teredinibacter turnerae]